MKTIDFLLSHVVCDGGNVDVSGVFSPQCYSNWLSKKKITPKYPEEAFRKVLIGHLQGLNGLQHFPAEIEEALLNFIRVPRVWPCFINSKSAIGSKGFRKIGYWESRKSLELITSKPFPFCSINDFYCTFEFRMPSIHERTFIKERPVGIMTHSLRSEVFLGCDLWCRGIYGGSIIGFKYFKFLVYKSCYYLYQENFFLELESKGVLWARNLEYKFDGTIFISLTKLTLSKKSPDIVCIEVQDVTPLFKEFPYAKN